jgi:hypothetical protein
MILQFLLKGIVSGALCQHGNKDIGLAKYGKIIQAISLKNYSSLGGSIWL